MLPRAMKRPSRRALKRLAVVLVLAYGFVIVFGGCADQLILHPLRGPIDAGRARAITVHANGRPVEVWTARSSAAASEDDVDAFVLEFCGNATRAEQIAQYVADRWHRFPVEAWVMNYPGGVRIQPDRCGRCSRTS